MSQSVKNPSPPVTPCPQVKAAGIPGPSTNNTPGPEHSRESECRSQEKVPGAVPRSSHWLCNGSQAHSVGVL